MKKRYEQELDELQNTYKWAMSAPIDKLCQFVSMACGNPLISVGSGGSYAAATMATMLHEMTGSVAASTTPFQLQYQKRVLRTASVLLMSASGKNPDILNAFRIATVSEPIQLMAICMRQHSPLSRIASSFSTTTIQEYSLPTQKDGFLATNSLLSAIIVLIRAYASCYGMSWKIPTDLFNTDISSMSIKDIADSPFLERNSFIVLYGGWGLPAAVDIESRFVEGALGQVQLADYRNFAHGRHHYLAKRNTDSAIIALITPDIKKIATQTINLIPENIPKLTLSSSYTGPWSTVKQIIDSMYLASILGAKRKIALSKPGVPTFGRKIYHLKSPYEASSIGHSNTLSKNVVTAIQRKLCIPIEMMPKIQVVYWKNAYERFLRKITTTSFSGIIFDYDGTLCDPCERFGPLHVDICGHLKRILRANLYIGIATGRGQSIRKLFQKALPKKYWSQIIIGYYNGSDIGLLNDDSRPNKIGDIHPSLQPIESILANNPYFPKIAKFQTRPKQISIEPMNGTRGEVRNWLFDVLGKFLVTGVQILESSHSFDILAVGVSKLNLIPACQEIMTKTGKCDKILCIGDKGSWPGNDCSLLSESFSLSVGDVSVDSETCWNLAPSGYKGVQSTIYYLESLRLADSVGTVKLDLPNFGCKK